MTASPPLRFRLNDKVRFLDHAIFRYIDSVLELSTYVKAPTPLVLDAVDPEACSDVLKSLVLALEPRLIDSQGFAALQAAISAAQSVEAAAGLHEELMSFLPPDEADLLMRLLRLLVAGVEFDQPAVQRARRRSGRGAGQAREGKPVVPGSGCRVCSDDQRRKSGRGRCETRSGRACRSAREGLRTRRPPAAAGPPAA